LPIAWFSKSQKTIKTSTFGSEFIALCVATELINGLCYKLCMLGVPLDGPANILVDNDSIIKNTTIPESVLQKKHNAICYHLSVNLLPLMSFMWLMFLVTKILLTCSLKSLVHQLKSFAQHILY